MSNTNDSDEDTGSGLADFLLPILALAISLFFIYKKYFKNT